MTDKITQEMARMAADGLSYREIGKHFNMTRQAVHFRFKTQGVELGPGVERAKKRLLRRLQRTPEGCLLALSGFTAKALLKKAGISLKGRVRLCGEPCCVNQDHLVERGGKEHWELLVKRNTSLLPSGCWAWDGRSDANGYFRVAFGGQIDGVHRTAYRVANGPIPEGMTVDHICFEKGCVNPDHLRLLSRAENSAYRDPDAASRPRKRTDDNELRGIVEAFLAGGSYRTVMASFDRSYFTISMVSSILRKGRKAKAWQIPAASRYCRWFEANPQYIGALTRDK